MKSYKKQNFSFGYLSLMFNHIRKVINQEFLPHVLEPSSEISDLELLFTLLNYELRLETLERYAGKK